MVFALYALGFNLITRNLDLVQVGSIIMRDCPVDKGNLSFSDDEVNALFITQSSCNNVDTQDVVEAVSYLETLGSVSVSDSSKVQNKDFVDINVEDEVDWHEHKDVQYVDFTGDIDIGCEVSSQKSETFLVTRHRDGQQFFVGDSHATESSESTGNQSTDLNDSGHDHDPQQVGSDLKRFGSAISDEKIEETKFKRLVEKLLKFFLNFQTVHIFSNFVPSCRSSCVC